MDPAPLLRDEGQEPHTLFHLTSTRNTVLPEQLQQMHLQRLEDARHTMPHKSPRPADPRPHGRHIDGSAASRAADPAKPPHHPFHARTLMPNPSTPSSDQIAQATATLTQFKEYLRTNPPVADILPLLARLLDEDTGVPILLGDVLRSAARLVSQQAAIPKTDEIRLIIDGLRDAAQEATDWHVLHWDVQRLSGHAFEPAGPPATS